MLFDKEQDQDPLSFQGSYHLQFNSAGSNPDCFSKQQSELLAAWDPKMLENDIPFGNESVFKEVEQVPVFGQKEQEKHQEDDSQTTQS